MDYRDFEADYFISERGKIPNGFINGYVHRSNSAMRKLDYYIHLIFLRYGTEKERTKARKFYHTFAKQKGELRSTYIVGMDVSNHPPKGEDFMHDGSTVSFDREQYLSVRQVFSGLQEISGNKIQSVIFKVKDGRPITDDAVECQISYSKADKLSSVESIINSEYLRDDYCVNICPVAYIDFIRPLISAYSADAVSKLKMKGYPSWDHFLIRRYKRGSVILISFLVSLALTLYFGYITLVDNFRPILWMMFLIPTTISIWFLSMYDSERLYHQMSISGKDQGFEFIPCTSSEMNFDLSIFTEIFGSFLTAGALIVYAKLGFILWEFIVCVIVGMTFFAVALIYKRSHPKNC